MFHEGEHQGVKKVIEDTDKDQGGWVVREVVRHLY